MSLSGLLVFAGVYFLAVASPGPAIAAIAARSLALGFWRTLPFVLGVALGDLVWFGFVAFGLAVAMQAFHGLFVAVKWAGCLYLLYLAWALWTAPASPPRESPAARGDGVRLFLGGLALTLGNPKVMVFFLSILPLVIDVAGLTPLAIAEVGLVIALVIVPTLSAYALAADRARRFVASPRAARLVNRVTGGVMAGAAALIATRG